MEVITVSKIVDLCLMIDFSFFYFDCSLLLSLIQRKSKVILFGYYPENEIDTNKNFVLFLVHTFAMALTINPQPTKVDSLDYSLYEKIAPINLFCLIVFNVEFVLKFMALGWGYFQDLWNRFDFGCVLSSNVGYVLEQLEVGDTGSLSIIRMFRVYAFHLSLLTFGVTEFFVFVDWN